MASKFYAKQVFFAQSLWYNETTVFDPYVQPHEKKRVVNMKHRSATLLSLLLVLCLLMPVWAFGEATGDTVEILFLGTSDVHGQLYATNYTADVSQSGQYARGLTRVATYVEEQRAQYENVFLGDCGDLVQGTPLTYYYAFYQPDAQDPAMKALRMMDYDLFVTGNHEYWLEPSENEQMMQGILAAGACDLDDEAVCIEKGDSSFMLAGLDDQHLSDETLKNLLQEQKNELSIVLAHEPQSLQNYANAGADLVLTGHAHGGQIRLPFVGGIVAPDQGFLPEYTSGKYNRADTEMIVSRGLGNSIIPVRLFNYPEVVCVELRCKN